MAKSKKVMSSALKTEAAKELGIFTGPQDGSMGERTSRQCGQIVRKAVEIANRNPSSGSSGKQLLQE